MDLTRLDRGLQIAGASAIALVVFMFFPWYGRTAAAFPDAVGFGVSLTAWRSFGILDIVLLAIAAFVVAVAFFEASGNRRMDMPIPASTLVAALGILAIILIAYRLIEPPFDLERRYGIYLGLLAAIGIAVGGRLAMGERRETFADARDTVSAQASDARRKAADTIGGDSPSGGGGRSYEDRTREELYEEATRRNIEGRSEMSKEELAEALRRKG